MPTIPAIVDTQPTDLTTFVVEVDGEALPGSYGVIGINVSRHVNRIPRAGIVLADGDPSAQDFEISSGDILVPGREIEIKAGYGTNNESVFAGIITKQRLEVKRSGGSRLHIEAYDKAFRMTLTRKSRNFTDLSDGDLFDELLAEHGLTGEVDGDAATVHSEIVQYQVSDWDLLVTRAERIGMIIMVEDGTVVIAEPSPGPDTVMSIAYGRGIFDVDIEMDARTQFRSVSAFAWDQAGQEIVSSDIDDVDSPPQGNLDGPTLGAVGETDLELRHSGALRQEDLDAWSRAQMLRSRFARIRGTIRIQGTSAVKVGELVDVDGLGERFKGAAFVAGIQHALGQGDWETTLQIGISPTWHVEQYPVNVMPAAGFSPAVAGLQVGVVTELEGDPDGEDRIRVKLPVVNADDEGVWARLASLDAGEDRGWVFRPEIGDEVIVGFIADDPHEPVVLGMLHSSAKPAPISGSDDNHEKGLVTRSGMRVVFNDDEPSLTIETPNGNKIQISDADGEVTVSDESGSTLTMSSDGILLDSAKEISIKAATDITIEGLNVNIKAGAGLTAEGSATASFKSGGSTELKGSIVQIN